MSENCKELENKAKKISDNPVVAKETYLQVARCWEKKYQKKKAAKAYEKVAQIVCNTADQFEDPEEAQNFYEEAIEYYKKIDKEKEVSKCTVTMAAGAGSHPILAGVKLPLTSNGSLYEVRPLGESTTRLLIGTIPDQEPEPVAWTNQYKKSRIFYTSLGHPDDFKNESFRRMLINAVFWAINKPVPKSK